MLGNRQKTPGPRLQREPSTRLTAQKTGAGRAGGAAADGTPAPRLSRFVHDQQPQQRGAALQTRFDAGEAAPGALAPGDDTIKASGAPLCCVTLLLHRVLWPRAAG